MTRDPHRPGTFTVRYRGEKVKFTRYRTDSRREGGYALTCPKHGTIIHIETDSGRHHSLTFNNRKATINPSILCRSPTSDSDQCGWHVWVREGIVVDA